MNRQVSLPLLALTLLLPASMAAQSPWDCTRQADGNWNCTPKTPPAPAVAAPIAPSPGAAGEPVTETPATGETGAAGEASVAPGGGGGAAAAPAAAPAAREPQPPPGGGEPAPRRTPPPQAAPLQAPSPGAPEGAAVPTAPGLPAAAPAVPATAVEPRTPPAARESGTPGTAQPPAGTAPAAGEAAAAGAQAESGRWALCPPVARPAPIEDTGTDTINLQADSAHAGQGNVYTLEGNAVAQYAGQRLEAEDIVYRKDSGEIEAQNGIRYTRPGLFVSGESATLYMDKEEGVMNNIEYVLYDQHGRGSAESSTFSGLKQQYLKDASYTTCPEGNNDWVLSAREVHLDQAEGTGTARDAKVKFKGVPFLYTPYATFPIDDRRKSGLLVPKMGQAVETGVDISVPVYWNIAPNRDMTFIPRYMSDRGTMLGTEFRYLNTHSFGRLSGDYLPSDKRRDGEYRSLVSVHSFWNPMPRLSTRIIASNASDEAYFEDLGNTLLQTSQTNLERTAAADYHGDSWNLMMMVQDFQTISTTVPSDKRPYKQLPNIVFSAAPEQRLLGLKVETNAELNYFVHSDSTLVEGSRVDIQPRLSLPVHRAAWYVDPAVAVRYTAYDLTNVPDNDPASTSRTTPIVSLDAGTFFDRIGSWGDSQYLQTLEPRMFYLYVPQKDQDNLPIFDTGDYDFNFWTLFRENRFSGPDRMGDANQLALALTTRILDPASGVQAFRASLGSLQYFSNRVVTLPGDAPATNSSSDLIGEMGLALTRYWNADADLQWNPNDNTTSRNDYRLQYRRGPRQLLNLSYRQRQGIDEQTDLSFLWPLSPAWHMVGRWYYSLKDTVTIETLAGIGYESCCWSAQLLASSFISNTEDQRNTSVFLQMELKGLGKLGTKVDDALERGILGYEDGS